MTQNNDRIVDLKKLMVGTKLLIETEKEIYEFILENPETNQVKMTTTKLFPEITNAITAQLVGCTEGGSLVTNNEIRLNKKLYIEYNDDGQNKSITTTRVINGKMWSPDEQWSVELWKDVINPYAYDEEKDKEETPKKK